MPQNLSEVSLQSQRQFFPAGAPIIPETTEQYSQLHITEVPRFSLSWFAFTCSAVVEHWLTFSFALLATTSTLISTCGLKLLLIFWGPILFLIIRCQQIKKKFQSQLPPRQKISWSIKVYADRAYIKKINSENKYKNYWTSLYSTTFFSQKQLYNKTISCRISGTRNLLS